MITINVIGLDETLANLDKLPDTLRTELSATLERGAQTFVRNAKRDAPVNMGVLRNEITYEKIGEMTFNVVSGANYSPYMEWGTITRVRVPGELAEYASQFKGRGIRKTGGISPHPYFFIQTPIVEEQLNDEVPKVLDDIKL